MLVRVNSRSFKMKLRWTKMDAASVKRMNTYMEESLATFRVSLTEALMGSTEEKMMRSFSEPIGYSKKEKEHKRSPN